MLHFGYVLWIWKTPLIDTVCSYLCANIFERKLRPITITCLEFDTRDSIPSSHKQEANAPARSHSCLPADELLNIVKVRTDVSHRYLSRPFQIKLTPKLWQKVLTCAAINHSSFIVLFRIKRPPKLFKKRHGQKSHFYLKYKYFIIKFTNKKDII